MKNFNPKKYMQVDINSKAWEEIFKNFSSDLMLEI